jgi:hypothetical protein
MSYLKVRPEIEYLNQTYPVDVFHSYHKNENQHVLIVENIIRQRQVLPEHILQIIYTPETDSYDLASYKGKIIEDKTPVSLVDAVIEMLRCHKNYWYNLTF